MSTAAWLRRLWASRAGKPPGRPSCRPQVEPLEDRWVPSAVGTPTQNFVDQVYRDLLHRAPDAGGLASWSQRINTGGLSRLDFALDIRGSDEGLRVQVNDLYVRFLRRNADQTAFNGWIGLLRNNSTEHLEARILASSEYFRTQGGGTVQGWLTAVYRDVLGRSIGSNELAGWTSSANTNRLQTADRILRSTEGRTDEVRGFYTSYLRRPADASGLRGWTQLLVHGDLDNNLDTSRFTNSVQDNDDAILASYILSSTEYFRDAQTLTTIATIPGPA
jgi:Domain of unknown function (DUF4214)